MMRPNRVVEQQAAERLAIFDKKVLASMDTLTSSGEDLLKVEPLNATAIASGLPAIQLSTDKRSGYQIDSQPERIL